MSRWGRREDWSRRSLAAVLAGDAIYNVIPNRWVDEDLERLRVPSDLRYVLAAAKGSGAVGLILGERSPGLGRAAALGLVLYFSLALLAHVHVRDEAARYGLAAGLLVWSAGTLARLSRSPST